MNPPLEELFPNLDPDFDPEPFYSEDLENDEEESDSISESMSRVYDSLAGALANHYFAEGFIQNPNDPMPPQWHLEMGPAFAEAEADASTGTNVNTEGADSSAPNVSVDADF